MRYLLDNDVLAQCRAGSEHLQARLRAMEDSIPAVTEVRGRGMLLAISLDRDCSAEIVDICRQRGLLVNNVRPNALRFMPPLNVSDDEIDQACDILQEAILEVTAAGSK
jgi:acetylornithine/succinyldiaminopimelate/putrescine aminotransferase